uniref:Uncharacterized protein n=1 Tax=Anguilla anguilla TaxID=7936 RepID=A0A0E9X835_ANGAN
MLSGQELVASLYCMPFPQVNKLLEVNGTTERLRCSHDHTNTSQKHSEATCCICVVLCKRHHLQCNLCYICHCFF